MPDSRALAVLLAPGIGPVMIWLLMEFGASSGVRTNFRKIQLDSQEALVLPTLALGK